MARPNRVLAFVGAHPDDDIMGISAVIASIRDDPELRFILILATDGAAGDIAPGSGATRDTLGSVRRRESVASWQIVGRPPDRHEWLEFDDGTLADLPPGQLEAAIEKILVDERPDVVVTFGPDGITGHPDHIAVGAATDAIFRRHAESGGPGFQRLLHGAFPRTHFQRMQAKRSEDGKFEVDPTRIYHPRSREDEEIGCSILLGDLWPVTREAMRAHASQWSPPWSDSDDEDWRREAGARHFVVAHPARAPGAPVLTSLFDGL